MIRRAVRPTRRSAGRAGDCTFGGAARPRRRFRSGLREDAPGIRPIRSLFAASFPASLADVLRAADGTELFLRDWEVPSGTAMRGAILLVHGLGEHSGRNDGVGSALAALGLHVRGYDQRGHGRSGGARGVIPRSEALLDDLRLVFDRLAAVHGQAPMLLGHSMGGAIAARAATGGWVAPRALILSSPALQLSVTRPQRVAAWLGRRLFPDRAVPNALPIDAISHDPGVVAAYRADVHTHDRITARLYDAMAEAGAAARRDAPGFTTPTLLLVAGADRIVDPKGAREFVAALPPGVGTLHWYDGLYHEVFNEREPDRTRVLADLCTWTAEQLDRQPLTA
jgi:alpha-beta hydrolase superfamily lysophospholipase